MRRRYQYVELCVMFFMMIVMTGCANVLVKNTLPIRLDTARYESYQISPLDSENLPGRLTEADYRSITDAIRQEMQFLGLKESKAADLFINIGITEILASESDASLPKGIYPAFITSRTSYLNSYPYSIADFNKLTAPGFLVFDVVDNLHQRLLGFLISEVSFIPSESHVNRTLLIQKLIHDLFRQVKIVK